MTEYETLAIAASETANAIAIAASETASAIAAASNVIAWWAVGIAAVIAVVGFVVTACILIAQGRRHDTHAQVLETQGAAIHGALLAIQGIMQQASPGATATASDSARAVGYGYFPPSPLDYTDHSDERGKAVHHKQPRQIAAGPTEQPPASPPPHGGLIAAIRKISRLRSFFHIRLSFPMASRVRRLL